jgi:cardiolipin synthase A/B
MRNFFFILFIFCCYTNVCTASSALFPYVTEIAEKGKVIHAKDGIKKKCQPLFYPGSLVILPQDGRRVYFEAFAAAKKEIRIEICVLEDPLILQHLQQALERGICVRVIVDNNKYETTPAEQENLATYLIASGGQLHLSNPIFPRSFPKVILIDDRDVLIGSACLDSQTFAQYRDYVYVSNSPDLITELSQLFENDWLHSAEPSHLFPIFNPTPPITQRHLMISPVNSSERFVSFIQKAEWTLDVTSELLGNPTLESELAAAVSRGVRVRLIAPEIVNNANLETQELQLSSLNQLKAAEVRVHVTRPPETKQYPYMHARTAIADKKRIYVGSISLSPNSITFNREVGIILRQKHVVDKMQKQFNIDYHSKSVKF